MLVGVSYLLLITMVYFAKFLADLEYFNEMEQPINQNHSQRRKAMFLPQMILKTTIEKLQRLYTVQFYLACYSYVTLMTFVCTRMSFVCHSYVIRISLVCTSMSYVCHSYILACHSYATRMYTYVIRMSPLQTCMSFVCYSCVLACHSYVTRMYSYIIHMSLVCTRMSFVCHSSVVLP